MMKQHASLECTFAQLNLCFICFRKRLLEFVFFLKMHGSTLASVLPLISLAAAGLIGRDVSTTACNRDNVFRCILGAPAVGSPYCSSVLSYGTVTSYTSTFTPTAYAFVHSYSVLIGS